MRWGIEISFRDLKYTLGLVNLHGKRDAYAEQEIYAAMTMFNLTNRIIRQGYHTTAQRWSIRLPSEF